MPITRKQFQLGINSEIEDWMKKIYAFLAEHEEVAYTWEELADSLEVDWKFADNSRLAASLEQEKAVKTKRLFDAALKRLVGLDCVEAREVEDIHYFAKGRRELEYIL